MTATTTTTATHLEALGAALETVHRADRRHRLRSLVERDESEALAHDDLHRADAHQPMRLQEVEQLALRPPFATASWPPRKRNPRARHRAGKGACPMRGRRIRPPRTPARPYGGFGKTPSRSCVIRRVYASSRVRHQNGGKN